MESTKVMNESFSIEFDGRAFDDHEIPASALAQSLLALDEIARRTSETVYGKDSQAELKVKAGFRKGSFIADLIVLCKNDPVVATGVAASVATVGTGVVSLIKGVIKLAKFSRGKKLDIDPSQMKNDTVTINNDCGQSNTFNISVVNIYNQGRTRTQLSRLTQTLDQDGVDSIKIFTNDSDDSAEVISKQDREYFRHEDGIVLTDNESEVILEVVGPMTNGSPKGWKFSEGSDGIEYTATVDDEDFLGRVKSRQVKFEHGTAIRAIVRTVQRKNIRTVTDRTIVEVKEVIPSSQIEF